MPSRRLSNWRSWAGYGLAAAALLFAGKLLEVNHREAMTALSLLTPGQVGLAVVAFGLHIAINACAFAPLNQGLGVSVPAHEIRNAWTGSLLAKYVPGGFWHVVGRGLLLSRLGVSTRTSLTVGVIEQGISLVLCVILAVAFLLLAAGRGEMAVASLAAGIGLVVLGAPPIFGRFFAVLRPAKLRLGLVGYGLAMVPYGLGYAALALPEDAAQFLYALFSGTVAGVLAVPVPGGLGVRESMATWFSPPDQASEVMAMMLFARVLIVLCEAVASIWGLRALRGATSAP
jgi:hypothetical protein